MRTGENERRSGGNLALQGEAAAGGPPGAGGSEGEGSPVTRSGTSGTGVDRATGRGRPERKAEAQRWPSGLEHPGQAVKPVTWARRTKKARGRRTERGSERKRRGRRGGPKALVDVEAGPEARKEANELVSEQGCRRRGRGHASGHQMRDSPGDQGRHRRKAEDNERMPPRKGIQCGGAERTGGTGSRRLRRRKAGRKEHEAPRGGGTQDAGPG